MGRDKVIEIIKSGAKKGIVLGGLFGVIFALFAFVLFVGEVPALAVFVGVMAVVMFVVMGMSIKRSKDPMCSRVFKRNPKILEQADELFANIQYQDQFIIYSDKVIANAKSILQMASFDDIIDITDASMSFNYVKTDHALVLSTPTTQLRLNIYGRKKETVQELYNNIVQHCPKVLAKQSQFRSDSK